MDRKKYNQHGDGTLSQRSDGRWEARITINGKRKCFYGKNEREAKKKMREYQDKIIRGEIECKRIKVSDYFQEWLVGTKKGKLKASSYDRLERTYRNHIQTTVGMYQLGNLTTKDCQILINQKSDILSFSSTKKVYEALNDCLKYAEAVGDIGRNPMKAVVLPSEKNFKKKTKEIKVPTAKEMDKLIETAFLKYANDRTVYHLPYAYAIIIISNTGLRVGELLALTWDKVNLEKATIKVDCSVSEVLSRDDLEGKKRKLLITDTKTKNGKRTIPLNHKAKDALEQLQKLYKEKSIKTEYVICNAKGNITNYRDIKRAFDKIVVRAEINLMGLHSIRHYFASMCIANKMGTFELSRVLGHGKVSVTMDIYGHIMENQQEEIRKLLEVI